MFGIQRRELVILTLLFLAWRAVLFTVSYTADSFLAYKPSFPYSQEILAQSGLPKWLYSWANFDGVHYITIAERGYMGTGLIQAFFPLYPLAVRVVNVLFDQTILAAFLLSNAAALVAVCLFFTLVKSTYSTKVAWRSCLLLLLFPTSFYLGATYNESLFLCFVLGAFLAAYKRSWLVAGILAGFASATRVVGVFVVLSLVLGLLLEYHQKYTPGSVQSFIQKWRNILCVVYKREKTTLFWLSLGVVGLFSYMSYLWIAFGDPLYFQHVQSEFGSGREERIIVLPQTLWRAIKIVFTVPIDIRYSTYLQELLYTLIFLTVLLVGFTKKFKVPYAWLVCSLLAVLLPTTTGTLSSMPRYVLVAFPFFVILAQQELPRYLWVSIYLCSLLLLLSNTLLFIQGYWVA
jgi:hypothetical protein